MCWYALLHSKSHTNTHTHIHTKTFSIHIAEFLSLLHLSSVRAVLLLMCIAHSSPASSSVEMFPLNTYTQSYQVRFIKEFRHYLQMEFIFSLHKMHICNSLCFINNCWLVGWLVSCWLLILFSLYDSVRFILLH